VVLDRQLYRTPMNLMWRGKKYWISYNDCDHLLAPKVPIWGNDNQDNPFNASLMRTTGRSFDITERDIKRCVRPISPTSAYLSHEQDRDLQTLEEHAAGGAIIVLLLGRTGDNVGRAGGLWFKMSFFEGRSRVPMMNRAQQMEPGLQKPPV